LSEVLSKVAVWSENKSTYLLKSDFVLNLLTHTYSDVHRAFSPFLLQELLGKHYNLLLSFVHVRVTICVQILGAKLGEPFMYDVNDSLLASHSKCHMQ
jgi:hypothetical protein